MNQAAQESAIKRDERAIFLPAKGEMQRVLAELKEAILYAIQTGDYSRIRKICKGDISSLLNDLTELAYLKGGRRAELAAEKVIEEPASEFAPVQFSLKSDSDARVRGTIDYLRRVSGLDPSKAQDKFEKHNAGEIGDLSDAIVTEVKKAVKDLVERGIHIEGGKDKIAQILAANQVGVLNTTALAETLFRTQSMQAYAAGRWNSAHDKGYGKYIWGFQYVTAHDNRVREGHRVLEGVRLPKDDPFWLKYFPPNGWNCRCTTLEIWTGDPKARIDFGITGKDPRKRTAEEMNVPEAFQGNVGLFTYTKEQDKKADEERRKKEESEKKQKPEKIVVPVKKKPVEKKPVEVEKPIAPPQEQKPAWVPSFKNPVHILWYDVQQYVPQMSVSANPKYTLNIVFTPRGIELKHLSRRRGNINVYRYDGEDHYTGAYSWKSFGKDEVDSAAQALDLLREYAAEVQKLEPEEIQFVIAQTSQKKLDDLAGSAFNATITVKPSRKPKEEKSEQESKKHYARKIQRQEPITQKEVRNALASLPSNQSANRLRIESDGNSLKVMSPKTGEVIATISKFSEEITELEK